MAEDTRQEVEVRRLARLAAGRLAHARWIVLAGAAAVLVLQLGAGASPWLAAAGVAAVAGAAMLTPRRSPAERRAAAAAAERPAMLDLSAESLAAAVADPLVVFDRAGTLVHANAPAQAAFGGLDAGLSLLLKFRSPEMQAAIESVREGRSPTETVDLVERLPVERVYRVTASAVGGGTGLFVLTFKDQSEARRIDRMRADFIANASHELRTPLASISGFVETLRGPARDDAAARDRFLQIMQTQTGRMARLIDDLLSLSRLEMKPYLAPSTRVDVTDLLKGVIASLSPLAADNAVLIEKRFGDEPAWARGDRDELVQVFVNLLENACKYGQSGGRVEVSIEPGEASGMAEIAVTVRDFGPGIAQEHIPRVTERFYRVDVEQSRAQKGTGLGLAIVKHILTRHDARLSIRSRIGEGAAFTVHLPAA